MTPTPEERAILRVCLTRPNECKEHDRVLIAHLVARGFLRRNGPSFIESVTYSTTRRGREELGE